jgi:hypothetical protein
VAAACSVSNSPHSLTSAGVIRQIFDRRIAVHVIEQVNPVGALLQVRRRRAAHRFQGIRLERPSAGCFRRWMRVQPKLQGNRILLRIPAFPLIRFAACRHHPVDGGSSGLPGSASAPNRGLPSRCGTSGKRLRSRRQGTFSRFLSERRNDLR